MSTPPTFQSISNADSLASWLRSRFEKESPEAFLAALPPPNTWSTEVLICVLFALGFTNASELIKLKFASISGESMGETFGPPAQSYVTASTGLLACGISYGVYVVMRKALLERSFISWENYQFQEPKRKHSDTHSQPISEIKGERLQELLDALHLSQPANRPFPAPPEFLRSFKPHKPYPPAFPTHPDSKRQRDEDAEFDPHKGQIQGKDPLESQMMKPLEEYLTSLKIALEKYLSQTNEHGGFTEIIDALKHFCVHDIHATPSFLDTTFSKISLRGTSDFRFSHPGAIFDRSFLIEVKRNAASFRQAVAELLCALYSGKAILPPFVWLLDSSGGMVLWCEENAETKAKELAHSLLIPPKDLPLCFAYTMFIHAVEFCKSGFGVHGSPSAEPYMLLPFQRPTKLTLSKPRPSDTIVDRLAEVVDPEELPSLLAQAAATMLAYPDDKKRLFQVLMPEYVPPLSSPPCHMFS